MSAAGPKVTKVRIETVPLKTLENVLPKLSTGNNNHNGRPGSNKSKTPAAAAAKRKSRA